MTVRTAIRRALIALAVIASTGVLVAAPTPTSAHAAAATTVSVVPGSDGVLQPGSKLTVKVTITAGAAVGAGSLLLSIDPSTSSDATALASKLSSSYVDGYAIGQVDTRALAAGASTTVSLSVAADVMSGMLGSSAGGYAVKGALWVGGNRVALGSAGIAWIPSGFSKSVSLTTVVPLTSPTTTTGLVSSDQIESLTAPGGDWDHLLRAVDGTSATIALDPEIPASIRVLGANAGPGAQSFLGELSSVDNEVLRLPYGDGDVRLQRLAGATSVLAPTSFAGSLVTSSPTAAPTPTSSGAGPTTSSSATPTTQSTDVASVTAWNGSITSVAWPLGGTASSADLRFLRTSGYTTAILSGTAVADTQARRAAGPLARVAGGTALVTDATITALFNKASSGFDASAQSARATLIASLATDAAGGAVSSVLTTASRDATQSAALGAVLDRLQRLDWIHHGTVKGLLQSRTTASVTLDKVGSDARVATAERLVTAEAGVRRLGSAIQKPQTITGPERLVLLGLLGSAWSTDTSAWQRAAAAGITRFDALIGSVHLDRKSTVNYVGGSGAINFSVVNNLTQPITIVLHGDPSNGRLVVEGTATATIAAESSGTVKLPVRSISNGSVRLTLTISTSDGWTIGTSSVAQINVNAGWEAIGAVVFITGIVGLFALGFYRNVFRRKRMIRKRAERASRG